MTTCKCERPAPLQTQVSRHICASCSEEIAGPDPRDAEIAALKAERDALKVKLNSETWLSDKRAAERDNAERDLARHQRALAAGPARLRALRSDDYSPGYVAGLVEAAQDAAMKEEP